MDRIEQYKKFFNLQRKEQEREFEDYAHTPMKTLFASGRAYCGEIRGIDKNGNVLIGVSTQNKPRLKIPMVICILKEKCFTSLGTDYGNWTINSIDFRANSDWHTSFSDIMPIYYTADNNAIGCEKVDYNLATAISAALQQKRRVPFVILENMPPTELLKNLKEYIDLHPENKELTLLPKRTYDEWTPVELGHTCDVAGVIKDSIDKNGITILQGPPGTGKSYTIADLITRYANEGKNICVTTQSNGSLISLIEQEPIRKILESGKIYKTNLTTDEKKKHPSLRAADKSLIVPSGELLCSTYYTLSRIINKTEKPVYDVIVIEEASQAFLTAIAAFKALGKVCLVVGDPLQLPPIVKMSTPDEYKEIDVESQANGMMTFIRSLDLPCYRLTDTYRLTPKSASQTGVFYSNHLKSVADVPTKLEEENIFFPEGGGCILYQTEGASSAILSSEALEVIREVETTMREKHPKSSLAILSPYVTTTERLQHIFDCENHPLDLTIETINRIQGLTVDYAIYYIPTRNYNFAFSENLFNVATSRSRTTTLIITDLPLTMLPIKSAKIRRFLSLCDIVNKKKTITMSTCILNESVAENKIEPKVVGFIDPSTFERKKKEIVQGKENIYIIDTNVFVNCPDVINKIDKKYQILLSAKVVDELDKLKVTLDIKGQKAVQDALRSINHSFEIRNLRMETANVDLLPVDFNKKSPDNQILSVALNHKNDDENPILLTSDNGLQLKAKGLGIKTITLKEILKH